MEVKKSTISNLGLVLIVILVLVGGFALFSGKSAPAAENTNNAVVNAGNKQIINLTAKGGYSPSIINAVAGKDTTLIVNTNNTFDCSSALTIPKLGVQKNLPTTGQTEIALGTQQPGSEIEGTCSMGMYNFKIKFS